MTLSYDHIFKYVGYDYGYKIYLLDQLPKNLTKLYLGLSSEEINELLSITSIRRRHDFIKSRYLIHRVLDRSDIYRANNGVDYSESGKYHFSITHKNNLCVLAILNNICKKHIFNELFGIDLENIITDDVLYNNYLAKYLDDSDLDRCLQLIANIEVLEDYRDKKDQLTKTIKISNKAILASMHFSSLEAIYKACFKQSICFNHTHAKLSDIMCKLPSSSIFRALNIQGLKFFGVLQGVFDIQSVHYDHNKYRSLPKRCLVDLYFARYNHRFMVFSVYRS